jgi:hypothetical protein
MTAKPKLPGWVVMERALDWDMEALRGFSDEEILARAIERFEEDGEHRVTRNIRRRMQRDIAAWRRTNP